MDIHDHLLGGSSDNFWFAGKRGLIDILLCRAGLPQNAKILNIGVGTGDDLAVIKKHGAVYGLDIDQRALDVIPDGLLIQKVLGDVCSIPFPDNFFDCVVAFDVLEHVKNDVLAAQEIRRVLKPGGSFVATVPAFPFLFSKHDVVLQHVRRYTFKQFRALLSKQCDILSQGYWMFFLFGMVVFQRLILEKLRPSSQIHQRVPRVVNALFLKILSLENWLIAHKIKLPIGTSLWAMCRKNR